ncbi:MAG: hypothetical protein BroJett040_06100 [Oligoflexia bacterium]|nr:MAG: hypothetical protein BroJett040_06100 [Oligoflexia bacterium]
MDPTTNFIRTSVSTKQVSMQETSPSPDQNDNSSQSDSSRETTRLQEVNVCYATVATDYEIQLIVPGERLFHSTYISYKDSYCPSIFQPPKIA